MVIRDRYELDFSKPPLGVGAMGIVYRAVDLNLDNCPVALKTVKDISNPTILELFDREWRSIAKIHHDNIVRIVDQGKFEDRGVDRPFIVMEFLDGVTLDKLIRDSSSRLSIENSLDFIYQVCNGLEKIHAANLVHRDLKPSNIFITRDNKVKIIDFGLAHLIQGVDGTSVKGTPLYMAPEQIDGREPTALSDQFALGVITYEALTRQRPFNERTETEIRHAILHETPPPASQVNPEISPLISCVIHKALAKKEQQRFANIRVFAETLRKAQDDGPIEIFNPAGMRDRLERARSYFKTGELDLASKTLGAIEAEGYFDEEIKILRGQIKLRERQRDISQRLETARAHMEASEYPLALEEIEAALEIDPESVEARSLQRNIESRSRDIKVEKWHQLAEKHYEDQLYHKASEAVQQVLKLQPSNQKALDLRVRIERAEREEVATRSQRRLYYEQAVAAYQRGDVDSAFSRMESLFRLGHQSGSKAPHDADSTYEKFFQEVRNSQDELTRAYNDARRLLAEKNYQSAIKICTDLLLRYPANAQLKALRIDAEDQEQRDLSAFIADVGRRLEAEPDLDKKVKILEEAVNCHPAEAHFVNKLKTTRSRRDMVQSIIDQKVLFEKQGNYTGALAQLKALQQIHPQYQGVERDLERLGQRLREQREEEKKAEWERQIQHEIDAGDWQRAGELLARAYEEFKDDPGLRSMETLIVRAKERVNSAWERLASGQALLSDGNIEAGLEVLRAARQANEREPHFLTRLGSVYLEAAERIYELDWKSAERLIDEALSCDPANSSATDLKNTLRERKRRDVVNLCLTKARELEADRRIEDAVRVVEDGLTEYPDEIRLQQLRDRYFRLRPDLAPKPAAPEDGVAGPTAGPEESKSLPTETPSWVLPVASQAGDAPAGPEPAAPIEKQRASKNESIEKWKKALSGRTREIAFGFAAVACMLLLFWGIHVYRHRAKPIEVPKLANVIVNNADPSEYRIVDSGGTDVTNQLSHGLPLGSYMLVASRPGFETNRQPFPIDSSTGTTKQLDVAWNRLPVALTIKMTKAEGTLKVDNADQTLGADLEYKALWQSGPHSISWQGQQGERLEVQFAVSDDRVEIESPTAQGRFAGIVAAMDKGKVTYHTINTGGLRKIVDGQAEPLGASGEFSNEDAKVVSFEAKSGRSSLGDFPTGQQGQRLIYIFLAPKQLAPVHKSIEKPIEIVSEPPPTPPTPAPPKDDLIKKKRADYLKRLGVEDNPK